MSRGPATTLLFLFLVIIPPACTPPQQHNLPPIEASRNPMRELAHPAENIWPYWPTSMRIHPLTRIVTDEATEQQVIEARIEMLDRDGHTTKGVGLLRVDLYDASDESPAGSHAEWNLNLRDAVLNKERFDEVTLTYLFKLEIERGELPEQPVLRVYFLADDGADLTARFVIRK